jgi:hypothetical protein
MISSAIARIVMRSTATMGQPAQIYDAQVLSSELGCVSIFRPHKATMQRDLLDYPVKLL